MKKTLSTLAFVAAAGVAYAQTYVTNNVPGGDFDPADPTYSEITNSVVSGGGTFTFEFPTSGGSTTNDNGYAIIDNTDGAGWGVWVIGNVNPVPIAPLGLVDGTKYRFLVDMRLEPDGTNSTNPGGMKFESWELDTLPQPGNQPGKIGPDSGDLLVSSLTTNWTTYEFEYTINPGADSMKFVGIWGAGSRVGWDNVRAVEITEAPLTAEITSPAQGDTKYSNYWITADAFVFPGSVTNVSFYDGGTLLGNLTSAPWDLEVSGAATGPASLTVVATDDSGNSVTSSPPVSVTITNVPVETLVTVDPFETWLGYMNVYVEGQTDPFYLLFETPWGVGDLTAEFSGSGTNTILSLKPAPIYLATCASGPNCSNGYTNDTYWYYYNTLDWPENTNGAVGFNNMEANMYVEPTGLNGNLVTFNATNLSAALLDPSSTNLAEFGWTCEAFIKDLPGGDSTNAANEISIAVTNGQPFSISLLTSGHPDRLVQYGFRTTGPNVWPTDVDTYGAVVMASLPIPTPTNVTVNSSADWLGYMNVYNTPQDTNDPSAYQFGSGWGTEDLKAIFDSFGLNLSPNNIGDTNEYWYIGGGGEGAVGNKIMEALMYVEAPTNTFPGVNLEFSGTVLSNSLVSASNTNAAGNGWTCFAFVRDFAPDYSSFNEEAVALTTPGAFSVSLVTVDDPNRHVQYGFRTTGPNVWVTDSEDFGYVLIENIGVFAPTLTPQLSGNNLQLSFPTQLGRAYTVRYKDNLTDSLWNTLTVTNGTGLNALILDPTPTSGKSSRYYQVSVE